MKISSSTQRLTRNPLRSQGHEQLFQYPPSPEEYLAKKAAGDVDMDLATSVQTSMSEEETEEEETHQSDNAQEERDELHDSGSSAAPHDEDPIDAAPRKVRAPDRPIKRMRVEDVWSLSSG